MSDSARLTSDEKVTLALKLCDHDICLCGETNSRGQIIGADTPADYPPDEKKEAIRRKAVTSE